MIQRSGGIPRDAYRSGSIPRDAGGRKLLVSPHKLPIRFYIEFLTKDWESLPSPVQCGLTSFLEHLEENPDDPELRKNCQQDEEGRFAYEFYFGYVLFWRVVREESGHVTKLLNPFPPIRIDVLFLRKPSF
jgi:hypothetical protein